MHDAGGKARLKLRLGVDAAAFFGGNTDVWRWWPERRWDGRPIGSPGFAVTMACNPSVAAERVSDPTVDKCEFRASRAGIGAGRRPRLTRTRAWRVRRGCPTRLGWG